MLAVIDTNIWISAIITPGGFCRPIVEAVRRGEVTPIACPSTQSELSRVINRPAFTRKYRILPRDLNSVLMLTVQRSIWIDDPPIVPVSRDRHDDILIAAALAAGAEYIVTRDDDLKRDLNVTARLAETETRVISVRDFVDLIGQPSP